MDSQRFSFPPGPLSQVADDPERIHGSRVGWVVGLDADGTPRVDFDDNSTGDPVPALCGALVCERTWRRTTGSGWRWRA